MYLKTFMINIIEFIKEYIRNINGYLKKKAFLKLCLHISYDLTTQFLKKFMHDVVMSKIRRKYAAAWSANTSNPKKSTDLSCYQPIMITAFCTSRQRPLRGCQRFNM